MPTRKQRRRQQKLRRHEWEDVWVDEEGHEVDAPPESAARAPHRAAATTTKRSAPARAAARAGRQPSPPSWQRVVKRGAIFAPIMFIVVYELQSKSHRSVVAALYQTALLFLFFVPFSYLMDRAMYRAYQRKTGAAPPPKKQI
jgi:hypothetical protein